MEKSSPFLSFHHPKRQINPRLLDAGAFQDGVQPVFLRFAVHDDEAAREKINHFLRKFVLFFVSLFVTLFHFLKSDVTVAFYFTNYI